nr:hypothetical protein [Tanacetum cinerariifolium]
MKMTAIMIMSQVIKAVIKRATVVMTIPNLTMKKCLILSMKLIRMNRVSNLMKRIMKKTLKMMKRKRMTILLKLRQDETNVKDKVKGDEDIGIDYTTNQFDDDVDERLNKTDECLIQKEGNDAEMINIHQRNENQEITLNQVIEDTHVTLSTVAKKTEVPVTSSSHSSDLASKFLNFADIPTTDAEIVSPMDVHVHHEVPSNQTPTLFTIPISVIINSSPVYSTVISQSLPSFTPLPQQSTPTPPPTTEATNPLSVLLNFASLFQFKIRVLALEKEVSELKKDDLLNTQVTALVDEHLDSRLGATRNEFMSYLLASITARIKEQVKI